MSFIPQPFSAVIFPRKQNGVAVRDTSTVMAGTFYRTTDAERDYMLLTLIHKDGAWNVLSNHRGNVQLLAELSPEGVSAKGNHTFTGDFTDPESGEQFKVRYTDLGRHYDQGAQVPSDGTAQLGILSRVQHSGGISLDAIDDWLS